MPTAPILVELDDLSGLEKPVQLVDTRIAADYRRGHPAGALHLDTFSYANERTDGASWPAVVRDWRSMFESIGIRFDETVVFYDGGLENRAARNGFMLRYLGDPRAHVLHGGLTAWVKAGLPLTKEVATRPASTLHAAPCRGDMVALIDEVNIASVEGQPVLLDVRDTAEYAGRRRLQWNPRMGRIPGARPLEWTSLLRQEQTDRNLVGTPYYRSGMNVGLRTEDELRAKLSAVGIEPESDVIVYCQKSHRACTVYLALERLGYAKAKVYPGSFREWSRRSDLPVIRDARSEAATASTPDTASGEVS